MEKIMHLKKFMFVALALSIFASPMVAVAQSASTAQPVNTAGLSEVQLAELNAKAAELRANTPVAQVEAAKEWVDIGTAVGAGLASAARETGQVVNDFAKTPVGQLTVAVIVFKVIGGDLIQFVVGFLFLATAIPIWFNFYKRLWPGVTVTTVYDETTKKRTTTKTRPALFDQGGNFEVKEDRTGYIFLGAIMFGLIIIAGMVTIFA